MSIDPQKAKLFVRLWIERYPKCVIPSDSVLPGEVVRSLLIEVAQDAGMKPREAYAFAQQLRSLGVKLPEKEDEERWEKKANQPFPWVKFGKMLIQTRRPKMVCEAFDLSDDQLIRLTETLSSAGVRLPKLTYESGIPEWLEKRMELALQPSKFTPEEKRTIGAKYRVARPKNKKTYYYNGTGCYRPRGQYKRRRYDKFSRLTHQDIAALAGMYG